MTTILRIAPRLAPAACFALAGLLSAGLLAGPAHASDRVVAPAVRVEAGGLVVDRLPEIFAQPDVARQATGGLTLSVVLRVDFTDATGPRRAAARVDLRYELWDEVFHVTVLDRAGPRRHVLEDREALAEWWRALDLRLLPTGDGGTGAGYTGEVVGPRPSGRVRLEVLPFSEAEREETQRWFSQSLEGAAATAAEQVGEGAEPGTGLSQTLGLLMATSIERRAVASFDWRIELTPEASR